MTFDGFSLFVLLLLAFAIPYSAFQMIRALREIAAMRRRLRKMDEMDASLDALTSEDFLGPRPW